MSYTFGPWVLQRNEATRNKPVHDDWDFYLFAANGSTLMCDEHYYPEVPDNPDDWSLIACAPEMAEMLLAEFRKQVCSCKFQPLVSGAVPCLTCQKAALLKKAGVLR